MEYQNYSFFENFISGMSKELQAQMRLAYARSDILSEAKRKREMEEMEQRITENVLRNISYRFRDDASDFVQELMKKMFDQNIIIGGK